MWSPVVGVRFQGGIRLVYPFQLVKSEVLTNQKCVYALLTNHKPDLL